MKIHDIYILISILFFVTLKWKVISNFIKNNLAVPLFSLQNSKGCILQCTGGYTTPPPPPSRTIVWFEQWQFCQEEGEAFKLGVPQYCVCRDASAHTRRRIGCNSTVALLLLLEVNPGTCSAMQVFADQTDIAGPNKAIVSGIQRYKQLSSMCPRELQACVF